MVVTCDVKIPNEVNLTMESEVNVSQATLMAAAPYIGKQCDPVNSEFILCRQESGDLRSCLRVGRLVTACAMEALRRIKGSCLAEFNQYLKCIDKSSGDYSYRHCRKTQAVFDTCMKEKLCVERPDFGYFCRGRIHKTPMPKPKPGPCHCHPVVPDPTPSLPDKYPRDPPPRFGSRLYYTTE